MKPTNKSEITKPETNAHGIPITERLAILASVTSALAVDLNEGLQDSIPTWPSIRSAPKPSALALKIGVKPTAPPSVEPHIELVTKLGREVLRGTNASRLQRVIYDATPVHQNAWIRAGWILQNWFAFKNDDGEDVENNGLNVDFDNMGLCYFIDQTAADIIESRFDMGKYTRKQFTDFRKKYGLVQVSKEHRRSGIIVKGCVKIQRIGRKAV